MPVFKFSEELLEPAYGIKCARVFTRDGFQTPFGAHTCKVEPGGSSAPHTHLEGETFFMARGRGRITIGAEPETEVGPGDVVFIPPHTPHVLVNASDSEPLWFTSVWWDPRGGDLPDLPSHSLIMAAPPTPNGDLHLGHLSGPYLALDALARVRRQEGVATRTACGSDEHQTYVATKSVARGETPTQTADHFSARNQATLKGMQMLPDTWLRPLHDRSYQDHVLRALEQLRQQGHVQLRPTPTPWCESCDKALVEAYVGGECPHCGEATSGNGCEACFVPNICSDLVDPVCNSCGSKAQMRSVERLVFPLTPWLERLRQWCAGCAMPDWLRQLSRKLEDCPTPDFPISHPGDWGLEVPDLEQRIFAWWEMPIGFLDFDTEGVWKNPKAEVVQAFGSDNAWYYLTLLPATLLALDPDTVLPTALMSNKFLLLDGQKFSTSRRHAIWGEEALEFLNPDLIRLGLSSVRPEQGESDFTLDGLRQLMNTRVKMWTDWWASVDRLGLECYPETSEWSDEDRRFHKSLVALWKRSLPFRRPESFSMLGQVARLDELAELASNFRGQKPLAYLAVGLFARLAEPIMPQLGAALSAATGMPLVDDPTCSLPPAGTSVGTFQGVDLGRVDQIEALASSRWVPS